MDTTTEEHAAILRICMAAYLGEKCQGCGKSFDTIEELKTAVWWPHDGGRVGHRTCFAAANPAATRQRNTLS